MSELKYRKQAMLFPFGEKNNILLFFTFYIIMKKIQIHEINDVAFPFCPVRNILARVGDKWLLLVLHEEN